MTIFKFHSLWVALLASLGTLGTVFVSQYAFGLNPCVLCLYQRWPYVGVIGLSVIGLMLGRRIGFRYIFESLIALCFASTAAIGGFHVGVEQSWWKGLNGCVADTSATTSMTELRAQIMSAPITKCDEVAWQLFGISMAGFNVIFASIMVLFMIRALLNNRS